MKEPVIDLSALPGLETATGVFGSVAQGSMPYSDSVVAVMVYVYDNIPEAALI